MNEKELPLELRHLFDKARLGEIDATQFYRALLDIGDLTPPKRIAYTRSAFGLSIEDAKRIAAGVENLSDDEWVVAMAAALDELYGSESHGETEDDTDQERH